ncbi:hypothetical protein BH11ACT8_BH11ACT8_35800 [soil metagenome]
MTERDLRALLDDAADDTGCAAVSPASVVRRERRRRARLRWGGGVSVGVAAAVVGVLVLTSGGSPAPVDQAQDPAPAVTTSPSASAPGSPSAECEAALVVDGERYVGIGSTRRTPPLSGRRVEATVPGCNDTGGTGPGSSDTPVRADVVEGVPSTTAVVWLDTLYVREGAELPASTDAWFRPLRCASDGPTVLIGDWLGVTTTKEVRFDGDLRTPLSIRFRIDETTLKSADYLGYTIRISDTGSADPALDKHAAQEALWSSRAQLRVQVHCDGGRFVADSFTLVPRDAG